jgi:glyoxylase-like metal-dependent hydrolase (beta-lactamase superfamily II)
VFCGDLLGNMGKPDVWSLIDDPSAAAASVQKLTTLPIRTIYPGHGKPFSMAAFEAFHRKGSSRIATA